MSLRAVAAAYAGLPNPSDTTRASTSAGAIRPARRPNSASAAPTTPAPSTAYFSHGTKSGVRVSNS
ncbi:hypothetical protein ACWCOV_03865 [Kribbella sp. NPDC002412]